MPSPLATALAYQGSVNTPTTTVAPTDVVGAYKNNQDALEKNYQAKIAQQNAIFGGLAGLGGAALMGPLGGMGGLGSLFGGGANPIVNGATYITGGGAGNVPIPTFR
jgi:hypothetical protein